MAKWLLILLSLCQCTYAQQQLVVYAGLNNKQQQANKISSLANRVYQGASVHQTEDTSTARNNKEEEKGPKTTLPDFEKALAINPNDTLVLYQLGHYFAADTTNTKKDSALKYYTKAISKSQVFYDAYLERGYLYALQFGNYKKAHKDFEKSIEIRPVNRYSYLYNGMLYFNEKDYENAKLMYDKAIELYPDFGEAYYERSHTWYEIGINTMVCSDLDMAAKLGFAKAIEEIKDYCQ